MLVVEVLQQAWGFGRLHDSHGTAAHLKLDQINVPILPSDGGQQKDPSDGRPHAVGVLTRGAADDAEALYEDEARSHPDHLTATRQDVHLMPMGLQICCTQIVWLLRATVREESVYFAFHEMHTIIG